MKKPKEYCTDTPARHKIDIFISSTFIDMEVERDIIVNHIIPRLEENLTEYGVDINAVDLRWGINTLDTPLSDEERNEKILKVCLSEIDRCKPYFIGIVGNRIGWRPNLSQLNNYIAESDWKRCAKTLRLTRPSVTALELYHALYQSDLELNHAFVMFRDPGCYDCVPANLRNLYTELNSEVETENIRKSITTLFFNNGLYGNVMGYTSEWADGVLKPDPSFTESLYDRLLAQIRDDLEERKRESVSWVEDEIRHQEYMAGKYVDGKYVADMKGRGKLHREVTSLLKSLGPRGSRCVMLTGESGSGKTAFAGRQARILEEDGNTVFFFSSGSSQRSFNPNNMLETFVARLSAILGKEYQPSDGEDWLSKSEMQKYSSWVSMIRVEVDTPEETLSRSQWLMREFDMLMHEFHKRFPDKVLYLVIDCYDGFDPFVPSVHLSWLNKFHLSSFITTLPSHIQIIREDLPEVQVVELPPFNAAEACCLIENVSRTNRKELYRDVRNEIMKIMRPDGLPAYSSPLWLRLVCHMLFSLNISDFRQMRAGKGCAVEKDIVGFITALISRIPSLPEQAFAFFIEKASQYISPSFTHEVLSLLAFSRFGLREKDLSALLGKRWNPLNFALLRYWFRPYFISSGPEGFWRIAHNLFAEAEKRMCDEIEIHNRLNRYLNTLPETDTCRVGEGMIHALGGDDTYQGILEFYVHECRLQSNIKHATEDIIRYIRSDSRCFRRFIDEIHALYESPDSSMQSEFTEVMKHVNECLEYQGEFSGRHSVNRALYDRVVHTLCSILVERGLMSEAIALMDVVVPMMETDNDEVADRFLLPLCYTWLADYYTTRYETGLADHYRSKLANLKQRLQGMSIVDEDDDEEWQEDGRILSLDEFYEAGMKYVGSNGADSESWNKLEETIDFILEDISRDKTSFSWVDFQFATVLIIQWHASNAGDPEVRDSYADILLDYPGKLAMLTKTRPIPVNELVRKYGDEIVDRLYSLANALESLSQVALKENLEAGEAMALDSLEIYTSAGLILDTSHALTEWSVSAQAVSNFYHMIGREKLATAHAVCAFNVSKTALEREPSSIHAAERHAYAAHNLGRLFFKDGDYEKAHGIFSIYLSITSKLHEINPGTLTITGSYLSALLECGDCLTELGQYQEAADNYSLLIQEWMQYYKEDYRLAEKWIYHYFSARYGIARILVENQDPRAYEEASNLLALMQQFGCPADFPLLAATNRLISFLHS